jgi:predicted  nucleic acid-binding Zn-ribbon protein
MNHNEEFEHDDCPKCGTPSVPFEGVPNQSLRGCPNCGHDWWENLNELPKKGVWNPEEEN